MNKILFVTRLAVMMCCVALVFTPVQASVVYFNDTESAVIQDRINNLTSIVEVRYTSEVAKRIYQYTTLGKKDSEVILGKVSLYFPIFENALRSKGMPDQLKYLPIIESSLRPNVVSRAGAAGLWQFMKGTGRMMDLKITSTIDERRDPVKATEAAVEYLDYLYNRFGSWTLALAAYNCGPGTVSKAIRKGNSKDFWEIRKFLPRETRNYVPKFIAISYLMNYYHMHDITPIPPSAELQYTATAKVFNRVSFKDLSKNLDLDLSVIKTLNPAFIRNYIPATDGKFYLTLPEQKMYSYLGQDESLQNLVDVSAGVSVESVVKVKSRESLEFESIDDLFSVSVNPDHSHSSTASLTRKMVASLQRNNGERKYKKLGRKESLLDISLENGIPMDQLITLNNIQSESDLRPGAVIRIQ